MTKHGLTSCYNNNNNGLFDLAATAGLETQSTYILHTEEKTRKYSPMFSNRRIVEHHSRSTPVAYINYNQQLYIIIGSGVNNVV